MTVPSLADALSGGGRFVKWDELGVGAVVEGTIAEIDVRQARVFGSTDPDFWPDGKPKMQVVISLQTDKKDSDEDDGLRAIPINLWSGQKKALADACKDAGVAEPQVGQTFKIRWASGVGKAGDPRVFQMKLGPKPAATTGLADALGSGPEPGKGFPDETPPW